MPRLVDSAAAAYLKIHRMLADSAIAQRVRNAGYNATFDEHERLLSDTRRIEAYVAAIERYVGEGDVVVDLGTGIGTLAFIAHRRRPKTVYAIEHSAIIDHAAALAKHNGLEGIEFVAKHSRYFQPEHKVDVIVQELMGSWLFNEAMVDSVLDLRDRALRKGGRILPSRFQVFFEPAELKKESVVPLIWDNEIGGVDYSYFRRVGDKQRNRPLMLQPHDVDHLLSEPSPAISFDLQSIGGPGDIKNRHAETKVVTAPGVLHGFVFYFKAFFDDELVVDTTPLPPYECLAQRRLPFYRTDVTGVREGDEISVELQLPELSNESTWQWGFSVRSGSRDPAAERTGG